MKSCSPANADLRMKFTRLTLLPLWLCLPLSTLRAEPPPDGDGPDVVEEVQDAPPVRRRIVLPDENAPAEQKEEVADKPDENSPSWLGLQLDMNDPGQFDEDEKPPPGVGVTDVMPNGPAAKAGLLALDRVLKIDGKEVNTAQELRTTVRAIKAGKEVAVIVLRGEKEETIKVVLEKMPAQANLMRLQGFNGLNTKPDKVHFYNNAPRSNDASGVDAVILRDGNRLEGQVRSLNANLLKLHLQSGPDVELDATQVESVRLSGESVEKRFPVGVLLRNGGWLTATEATLQEGHLTLNSTSPTVWNLAQTAVAEMFLQPSASTVLYQGPGAQDGWKASPATSWSLKEGTWEAAPEGNGTLAKKFTALPGSLEFSFDFTLDKDQSSQLTLFSYRADLFGGSSSPGMVQMQINQGVLMVTQFDGMNYLPIPPEAGQAAHLLANAGAKAVRLAIFCDREKGRLAVLSDGRELGQYQLAKVAAEDLPRAGRVIQFVGAKGTSLTHLVLRPWHGWLPTSSELPLEQDNVSVGGTAPLQAAVKSIRADHVELADGQHLSRKESIALKFKSELPPATTASHVWLETRTGSAFAAQSLSLVDGRVEVQTDFAGLVSLPVTQVRLMAFNAPEAAVPAKPGKMDVLVLRNGQQLRGAFSPPVSDKVVRWKISAAAQPLAFSTSEIASIQLAPKAESPPRPPHVARLRNGDWLAGELTSVDATGAVLQTSFQEALRLPADRLLTLYASPATAVIADGGSGRKRWKEMANRGVLNRNEDEADREWGDPEVPSYRYLDGGYHLMRSGVDYGNGDALVMPIAETSAPLSIEFTVSGVENWLSMQLMDAGKQAAFLISCSGERGQISLRQNVQQLPGGGLRIRGGQQFPFQLPKNQTINDPQVRLQIVLDGGQRAIHLFGNGEKLVTGKLSPNDSWSPVRSLSFMPATNGQSKFRVSDVWLAPWIGNVPLTPPEQLWVALANGDGALGRALSLNDSTFTLDLAELGTLSLPTTRVRALAYPNSAATTPAAYRLRLYDCGQLSASELHIDEHRIIATTELGEFALPLEVVKEIVLPAF